jgi:ABC-type lipoprotein release transport system permease subunit
MLTLKLAWRAFLRHKRRSIITGAAIALGLALLLVSFGLGNASHDQMIDMGVRMGAGHVTVQAAGYADEPTLDHVVENPAPVIAAARALPRAELVVPRVRASGLLTAGASSAAVAVSGVAPELEARASLIASPDSRVAGDYLRPLEAMPFENMPPDIYLGDELAESLELAVEDRVVLTVSPRGGERPAAGAFVVRGIFATGVDELDGFYVEIPIDSAQALLGLHGAVTEVAVLLDDTGATAAATRELRARVDDPALAVRPWQETLRELYEGIVLDDAGNYIMNAIIFLIVAIGIFNTILMSVVERTRELGVMMALGTSRLMLFRMVLVEALILGLVAAAAGLALGLTGHALIAHHGIDISSLYGGDLEMAGIVFSGKMYSELPPGQVVQWTVVVVGIVLLSALYPAFRATRLEPVEAMRHA